MSKKYGVLYLYITIKFIGLIDYLSREVACIRDKVYEPEATSVTTADRVARVEVAPVAGGGGALSLVQRFERGSQFGCSPPFPPRFSGPTQQVEIVYKVNKLSIINNMFDDSHLQIIMSLNVLNNVYVRTVQYRHNLNYNG